MIDSSEYIDSLIVVLVYVVGNRIVTILGENHDSYFKCQGKSISVNSYVEERLLDNEMSSVLLEFNKDTDNIKDLGSFNLINTVNNLKKKNIHIPKKGDKNDKRIKSVDYRDYFFNSYNLYADDEYFLKLSRKRINKEFIYPYFKKKNSFLKNGGNFFEELFKYKTHNVKIPERIYKFLEHTYIPSVELDFEKIYFELFKSGGSMIKKNLLRRVREVWAKVADFYIILEMFDLNCRYNEKIILIGTEHCYNIENVMKKIGIKPEFKMTNYDENPKKCIKNNFFFKKYISLN